jgi:hypothetical protein
LPLVVRIDPMWTDVLACHVSKYGIFVASFSDPW